MADIKLLLTALGTLAGFAQAEIGGEIATDTSAFTDALNAVDKTKTPTIEDWTGAAFDVVDGCVAIVPESPEKDKIVALVADFKKAVLDGEAGKALAIIGDIISIWKDIKAFKKA